MSKKQNCRLISFDVWSTLIKANPEYKTARLDLIRDYLAREMSRENVAKICTEVEAEMDTITEYSGIHYGFYDSVVKIAQKLDVPLPDTLQKDMYAKHALLIAKFPPKIAEVDLISTLMNLSLDYKLGVISNTGFIDGDILRSVLNTIGIGKYFDPELLLFSNELNLAKPDARVWQELSHRSGVALKEILHVGDNLNTDYFGAQKAGCQAIHLCSDQSVNSVKIPFISALL